MLTGGADLRRIGVTATDANGALMQLADLFADLPDGMTKTALAVKLFGKAGMDMIPLLNQGSEGLREAADKSRVYGERMAILAPLADKFNDQLEELALQSKASGLSIATYLLPGLIGVTTWLADLKSGGERAEKALEFLSEKSPLFNGLVKLNKLLNGGEARSQGFTGKLNAFGLPESAADRLASDIAAFDDATTRYMKERESLQKAKELLGKEVNDKESSYLATLRQQLNAASGDLSEYSRQLLAITQGSAKDFSQQTKSTALALALQIDKLKEATKANEAHARVLEKVAKIEDAAAKVAEDFRFTQQQSLDDIANKTAEVGKTPQEIAQLEAARSIQKAYETAVKKINDDLGKIGDIEGIDRNNSERARERDEMFKATSTALAALQAQQDAINASWEYGAQVALRKYGEEVANIAASTEAVMTRAFHGMEDALVRFVKTGKLDFKSLADYIESEFIRLAVVRPAVNNVAKAFNDSGGLGGLFNSVKSLFGFATGGSFTVGGEGGTDSQLVAFRATPGERVTIATPAQQSGGGIVIQQHIYPAPGVSAGELMQAMVQAKNAAVAEIHNSMRRGGSFA
jgi:lambda family phage tail tape measure protein